MTYNLKFAAYCGMSFNILDNAEKDEVKTAIHAYLRNRRNQGYNVTKIKKGTWEINDDNELMVSDRQGLLFIQRIKSKS